MFAKLRPPLVVNVEKMYQLVVIEEAYDLHSE